MANETGQKKKGPKIQIHPSAIKRDRQNKRRHARRHSLLTKMRTQIKHLRVAMETKDKKASEKLLQETLPLIAKMGGKKIIHRRTAARYTSRLTKQFNTLG